MTDTRETIRHASRALSLGEAVPVSTRAFGEKKEKAEGKSAAQMVAEHQDWLDEQPATVRCALCPDWSYTGPAAEARAIAAQHRRTVHPGRKTQPTRDEMRAQAEREAEWRRQRAAVDAAAAGETPVEEAAAKIGAAAVSSNGDKPTTEEELVIECKIDGCTGDASSAPKAGPTARLCDVHRAERSAAISAERTGKPRGAAKTTSTRVRKPRVAKTIVGVPPSAAREVTIEFVRKDGPLASKAKRLLDCAVLVDQLEQQLADARASLDEAKAAIS